MNDLRAAWADVIKRAKLVQHHKISREELSVREHMSVILRRLQNARFMEFSDLFDTTRGVPVVVVNFIAMLELSRESLIEITQAEPYRADLRETRVFAGLKRRCSMPFLLDALPVGRSKSTTWLRRAKAPTSGRQETPAR